MYRFSNKAFESILLDLRLPCPIKAKSDPIFLAKFIRTKKYQSNAALTSIEKYYKYIHHNFDIIQDINPSQFTQECQAEILTILKNRSEGARVVIFKMKKWIPKKFGLRNLQMAFAQLLEFAISREIETQKNGLVLIFDLQGFKFEHLRALSVKELHRMLTAIMVSSIYMYITKLSVPYTTRKVILILNKKIPAVAPALLYAQRIFNLISSAFTIYYYVNCSSWRLSKTLRHHFFLSNLIIHFPYKSVYRYSDLSEVSKSKKSTKVYGCTDKTKLSLS